MTLSLGRLTQCGLCAESHYVWRSMQAIHVFIAHPIVATIFMQEGANIEILFFDAETWS